MKILVKDNGLLTNYEVQQIIAEDAKLLESSSSSSSSPMGGIPRITKEEEAAIDRRTHFTSAMQKYFDRCYPKMKKLKQAALEAFLVNIERYNLEEDEVVQIVNFMPVEPMFIYGIIQDCDNRYTDQQVEKIVTLIKQHLINGEDTRDPIEAGGNGLLSNPVVNKAMIPSAATKEDKKKVILTEGVKEDEEDDMPLAKMEIKTAPVGVSSEAASASGENGATASSEAKQEVGVDSAEPRLPKGKRKSASTGNSVRAKRPVREKRSQQEHDSVTKPEHGSEGPGSVEAPVVPKRMRRTRHVLEHDTEGETG